MTTIYTVHFCIWNKVCQVLELRNHIFFTIVLPASVPQIFAGLQVALSSCWGTILAAEMVRSSEGLGWIIVSGGNNNDMKQILVGIVTIGIVGFGSIGRQVAKIAEAFGMKVLMNRKSGEPLDGYICSPLKGIYRNSDVISLCLPLTDDNRYMINRDVFAQMRSSAILINTARGPLVNQTDLANALKNGEIAGAGIDVLDEEPPRNGNPLLDSVPNCIVTPHSAWSTLEARQRLVDQVALNIQAFVRGEQRNIV